jgi:hypothetical protein
MNANIYTIVRQTMKDGTSLELETLMYEDGNLWIADTPDNREKLGEEYPWFQCCFATGDFYKARDRSVRFYRKNFIVLNPQRVRA